MTGLNDNNIKLNEAIASGDSRNFAEALHAGAQVNELPVKNGVKLKRSLRMAYVHQRDEMILELEKRGATLLPATIPLVFSAMINTHNTFNA